MAAYSYSISGLDADEAKLHDAILAAVEKYGGETTSFVATGGEINVSDLDEARAKASKKSSKKDDE